MMREVSGHTDPHTMIAAYDRHLTGLETFDRYVSLSRRGMERPRLRVTRDSAWTESINPWTERDRLPTVTGGLLAELAYAGEARVLIDPRVEPDDPGASYIGGYRTVLAVPHFDAGEALNWVLHLRRGADFDPEDAPDLVWQSGLFGRMTYNLVLAARLREANAALDAELADVARVQRALLQATLPASDRLRLAAHSRPARRAGGDYYGARALADGRVAFTVADVSGHSAQATVLMGMVHALLHQCPTPGEPGEVLRFVNRALCRSGPAELGSFVTAFCGVLDASGRAVTYASAGHPPALLRRGEGSIARLDGASGLPLGVTEEETYRQAESPVRAGEAVVCFTDGVTEARSPGGEWFGDARLERAVGMARTPDDPNEVLRSIQEAIRDFAGEAPGEDDRTLLVACVT